jgi:hypothetical protein
MIKNRFKSLTKKLMQEEGRSEADAIEIIYRKLTENNLEDRI